VQSLLDEHFAPEFLDGANKYFCSTCNKKTRAKKTVSLTDSPDYLFLTLLRFVYDWETQQGGKKLHEISFDPRVIVKQTSHDKRSIKSEFGLYGVIFHSGLTVDVGHYYAFVRDSSNPSSLRNKNSEDAPWFRVEDQTVKRVDWATLENNHKASNDTPYIFLYRRLHPDIDSNIPRVHDPRMLETCKSIRLNIHYHIEKSSVPVTYSLRRHADVSRQSRYPTSIRRCFPSAEYSRAMINIGIPIEEEKRKHLLNRKTQCRFCGQIIDSATNENAMQEHEATCRYRRYHVVKCTSSGQFVLLPEYEKHLEEQKKRNEDKNQAASLEFAQTSMLAAMLMMANNQQQANNTDNSSDMVD